MKDLVIGQKIKLQELLPDVRLALVVDIAASAQVFCLGLKAGQQLADPGYLVFAGNQESPDRALQVEPGIAGGFRVHLDRLPADVERVAIAVAGETADLRGSLRIQSSEQVDLARFAFGDGSAGCRAVIVAEIYRKDVWRLAAVDQGFKDGLDALWRHFAISRPISDFLSLQAPARPAPASPAATPGVRLGKVTLQKSGDKQTVSLKKGGNNPIHVNLNWEKPERLSPLKLVQRFLQQEPDLDLGCFYLLDNGQKGVIQPLGGNFGAKNHSPYIFLDKDDRSGAAADGENLYLYRPESLLLVVVFAFIYEGASGFRDVNGRMRLRDQFDNEILVPLDNPAADRTFCAICTIQKADGGMVITKEERYFRDHREADEHYGFGFNWVSGSK